MRVGDRGVQLVAGEQHDPADRRHHGEALLVGGHRVDRRRVDAGVLAAAERLDVRAPHVGLVVVVLAAVVLDHVAEAARVELHDVVGLDRPHRHPPVDLLLRSAVPGVAVHLERVGDARGQPALRERGAQLGHVGVGHLRGRAERAW